MIRRILPLFLLLAMPVFGADKAVQAKLKASAIQIEPTDAGDTGIPKEFCFGVYEHLLDQIRMAGTFQKVVRSGDKTASTNADMVTLRTSVQKFKEGSQLARETVRVVGATAIEVTVTVADKDGKKILEKNVTGRVRFFGDNLGATKNLAKSISKMLAQNFAATGTPAVAR